MPNVDLVCWKCGASLAEVPMPLGRLAECTACEAPLHVCRLCEFYEPRVADQCREPIAAQVSDKQKANFCDYFRPRPGAYQAQDHSAADESAARLADLFGLDRDTTGSGTAGGDKARQELDRLFGLDKDD